MRPIKPIPREQWRYRGLWIKFCGSYEIYSYLWVNEDTGQRRRVLKDIYRLQTLGAGSQ